MASGGEKTRKTHSQDASRTPGRKGRSRAAATWPWRRRRWQPPSRSRASAAVSALIRIESLATDLSHFGDHPLRDVHRRPIDRRW